MIFDLAFSVYILCRCQTWGTVFHSCLILYLGLELVRCNQDAALGHSLRWPSVNVMASGEGVRVWGGPIGRGCHFEVGDRGHVLPSFNPICDGPPGT